MLVVLLLLFYVAVVRVFIKHRYFLLVFLCRALSQHEPHNYPQLKSSNSHFWHGFRINCLPCSVFPMLCSRSVSFVASGYAVTYSQTQFQFLKFFSSPSILQCPRIQIRFTCFDLSLNITYFHVIQIPATLILSFLQLNPSLKPR